MGKIIKKGTKGAAANYMTRNQALKRLQISLADFRRLCILKGIYPREPHNRKKAAGGSTAPKTFYFTKDIQYLLHEPVLDRLREQRAFQRKIDRAHGKRQWAVVEKLQAAAPQYSIDHLVKERYPRFIDAVRDLDDCLCMLFLYATLPVSEHVSAARITACQRLTAEFMHHVMAAHCLRKAFLSIKGIYYQAEIMGEKVTWIVPWQFSQETPHDVDFRVMGTFVEFYETLMRFVNYKLYASANLVYPPEMDEDKDRAAAGVNAFVVRAAAEGDVAAPEDDDAAGLFSTCVFFLSREVPRHSLEFVIRAFHGHVGWDPILGAGSPFGEDDPRITHQICDRPTVAQKHAREYVQPQWVYDCANAGKLLKVVGGYGDHDGKPLGYGVGCTLPAHLSPFVDYARDSTYIPDEAKQQGLVREAADGADAAPAAGDKAVVVKTDEQKKLAVMMMNKKDRRLYGQIQHSKKKEAAAKRVLSEKKTALSARGKSSKA